jgi:hypothetical protein
MAVSSVANLATMLITAQGIIDRHPRRTATTGLTRTHLIMDLHRKTLKNQSRGRVIPVTSESIPEDDDVVYGMFLINSIPSSVLFDSSASHSFVTK